MTALGPPLLRTVITWDKFEAAVQSLFRSSLEAMAQLKELPQSEEPINLVLYRICMELHLRQLQASSSMPFVIVFDCNNQPEPDDTAESRRLKKRPDFLCILKNDQADVVSESQIKYTLECKSLGQPRGSWDLNANYATNGILRFVSADYEYAKGCSSAMMVAYVQDMDPEQTLAEVNGHANQAGIPSLTKAAAAWSAAGVTELLCKLLTHSGTNLELKHAWVDLRHCKFIPPQPKPAKIPKSAAKKSAAKKSAAKKSAAKKSAAKKSAAKKSATKKSATRKSATKKSEAKKADTN